MRRLILSAAMIASIISLQSSFAQSQPSVQIQPLSMKYDATAFDTPPVARRKACAIRLMPTVDARLNKDTLGTNFSNPLLSGDAGAWATAGLMNLKAFGFHTDLANDANRQDSITLSSKITRAYTWQVGLKLFGTVVIKVDYKLPNDTIETITYRASGNKTNMWGADDEYMTTLNYSLNNLLQKIASDIEKRCDHAV